METSKLSASTPKLVARLGIGAAALLTAALGVSEGRKYIAYNDIGGIPTVCDGITGPDVIQGKVYTDKECDALIDKHASYHAGIVLACLHSPLTNGEKVAWVHFAYNVGGHLFCRSTAARLINQGLPKAACAQIKRWTFVGKKDCRDPRNKCSGIINRRDKEYSMCMADL